MTDVRLDSAPGGRATTPAASSDRGLKTAAPMAAGALGIGAAIIAATLFLDNGKAPETGAIDTGASAPTSATTSTTTAAIQAPEPGSAIPGVAFDQTPAATAPRAGIEIVVKFKDDAKVKDIIDAFWRDQASAKAKFETFKAGKAAFAGLKLDRVTYSNELVLVAAPPSSGAGAAAAPAPGDARAAMRAIAAKLAAHPDVAYAEPNMTAQPGGQ